MVISQRYDIIVSIADIAGCEAAFVSSKMGAKVLLITPDIDMIANLYCGHKLGGGEKGIIIREIDALGGIISRVADASGIHFMPDDYFRSPVALCDRHLFTSIARNLLLGLENLDVLEDEIMEISFCPFGLKKISTKNNNSYETKCLILTYLNSPVSQCMERHGFKIYNSTIITAPVLNSSSISFDKLILQKSVDKPIGFSHMSVELKNKSVDCWRLKINQEKIKHLLKKFNYFESSEKYRLPFNEELSTEQEILFCPFGYDDFRIYVEKLEMFLPIDVQKEIIHTLDGCENAKIVKYGCLLEFHSCDIPLKQTLEALDFPGLFLVGFANGTTGYEEIASEGLIAGINAALIIKQKPEFIPLENLSVIGNLLLRLVKKPSSVEKIIYDSKSLCEHYYARNIRPDNADIRLLHYGYELGLIEQKYYESFLIYKQLLESELQFLKNTTLPGDNVPLAMLIKNGVPYKSIRMRLDKIAKRKKIPYNEGYYKDIAPWNWRKIEKEIEYTLRNEK